METIDYLRLGMLITSIIGIVVWWHFAKTRGMGLMAVTPLAFFIHILIFYFVVFAKDLDTANPVFITWSAAIRLQSLFTVILLGLQIGLEVKPHGK